jgi:hypothetical protein
LRSAERIDLDHVRVNVDEVLNAVIVNCRVALGVLSGRFHFVSMMPQ